jgi:hypothetical protein
MLWKKDTHLEGRPTCIGTCFDLIFKSPQSLCDSYWTCLSSVAKCIHKESQQIKRAWSKEDDIVGVFEPSLINEHEKQHHQEK